MQVGQFQFKFGLDIISSQSNREIIAGEIDGLVQECGNERHCQHTGVTTVLH